MPENNQLTLIKQFLKERLTTDHTTLFGYASESYQIKELISRTVDCGESNSALIIGPKCCGKTTLIASVLSQLLSLDSFRNNALIVHLNGFVQINDSAALKSITRQLQLETAVDGKVFTNFADNLAFLLDCLRSGDSKHTKSVVFILDEFDLFCGHSNQTLIYNLFDVAQSAQAPICVIGLTRRNDVIETLEKRVKSRFSHRQIFLFGQPNNETSLKSTFVELLKIPINKELKQYSPKDILTSNYSLGFLTYDFDATKYIHHLDDSYVNTWNSRVGKIASNKKVQKVFETLTDYTISLAVLKKILFQLIASISEHELPSDTILATTVVKLIEEKYLDYDDKVAILCDLSVLEFSLVVAIKHYSEIYDRDPFTFEMILTRLHKFKNSNQSSENYDRTLVLKAFDVLKNVGVIVPISGSAKCQKEFQMHKLLLQYNQILKAADCYQGLPTKVIQWAKSCPV